MKKKNSFLIFPLLVMGVFLMFASNCKKDKTDPTTVKDIDGNVYTTVTIGTQVWMVENLKVTKFRNGDAIPNVTDNTQWTNHTGAYCNYDNDENNSTTYGRLYNWYAVNDIRNIAPNGWHVPTDADWTTLENYLIANGYNYDGTTTENKIAKSLASTTLWAPALTSPGAVGNTDYPTYRNKSGFTALPAGSRYQSGSFNNFIGKNCSFWTATEISATNAYSRFMSFGTTDVYRDDTDKGFGFSVRCLKD